ncbi:MAG: ATP-binding protein [Magnetospirillum sp.]|nr:ATP-binding protein [Magnetospirillum sp.]
MATLLSSPLHATGPTDRRPVLVVEGAIGPDLAAQCRTLSLDVVIAGQPVPPLAACILAGSATAGSVRAGLAPPYCGFIELGPEGIVGIGMRCLETARAGGLTLSLQTITAYRLETLEYLVEAIRGYISEMTAESAELMDISLAEAISNAVIHGNLGIPSHLRTTTEGFAQFQRLLHKRMADPVVAGRRLEINIAPRSKDLIMVAVSDQGAGFDLAKKLEHTAAATAKNGRGLNLIRRATQTVHGEDGGRTLVMTFAR